MKKLMHLALLLLAAGPLFAQTGQGVGYHDVVFQSNGRPAGNVSVRICTLPVTLPDIGPCAPLAVLYSDDTLTTPILNPLTTDVNGNFSFYVPSSQYRSEYSLNGTTVVQRISIGAPGNTPNHFSAMQHFDGGADGITGTGGSDPLKADITYVDAQDALRALVVHTHTKSQITDLTMPLTKTAVAGSPLLSFDAATGAFTQGALTAAQVGALSSSTVLPATKAAVAGSPLLSYDATTGLYTQGALTAAQVSALPASTTLAATKTAVAGSPLLSFDATTGLFTQGALTAAQVGALPSSTVLPANTTATGTNFFTAYNSGTGAFTKAQPAFTDISGTATMAQLTRLGTGTKVATTSATAPASNKCVEFDTNGNLVVAGSNAVCGSGGSGMTNPMTTLGDVIYEDATPTAARLAGNITATKKYFSQTGNGSISAVPAWAQVAYGDLSGTPVLAATQSAVAGSPLLSYDATTGAFTQGALTATNVGLGSVTNDAQTKAALVPNTVPSAGQMFLGNAGGTAFGVAAMSQDCTISSTGAITCTKTNNVAFGSGATMAVLGTGTKLQTTSATAPASAKCTEMDTNGNIVIAASNAACGSSSSLTLTNVPLYIQGGNLDIAATGGALNASKLMMWQFFVVNAVTIGNFGANISTADAVNSYDFGIYDNSGNLIAHTGAAVGPSATGLYTKALTGSVTLTANSKYFFVVATGATAPLIFKTSANFHYMGFAGVNSVTAPSPASTCPGTLTVPAPTLALNRVLAVFFF